MFLDTVAGKEMEQKDFGIFVFGTIREAVAHKNFFF